MFMRVDTRIVSFVIDHQHRNINSLVLPCRIDIFERQEHLLQNAYIFFDNEHHWLAGICAYPDVGVLVVIGDKILCATCKQPRHPVSTPDPDICRGCHIISHKAFFNAFLCLFAKVFYRSCQYKYNFITGIGGLCYQAQII